MRRSTPLGELIERRMADLGLTREELGRRLGYSNPARASGRVVALCDGHITSGKSRTVLSRLALALQVDQKVLDQALVATQARLLQLADEQLVAQRAARDADELLWRATFKPHAVLLTEHTVPTQITICGMVGGPRRFLIKELDASKPPITFVQQAIAALPCVDQTGIRRVPFFGAVEGFVVNYSPSSAVRFDLDGVAIEVLSAPYVTGEISVTARGHSRSVPSFLG